MQQSLPRVFHIGLPRTATTTIRSVLETDPRISLSTEKYFQLSSFSSKNIQLQDKPNYLCVHSDETMLRQSGDHVKMLLTLWRIYSVVPDAKIILTIREQRNWLFSRYKAGIKSGSITSSFEKWLFSPQGIDFQSLGHYGIIYDALAMYFSEDNIFILPFEVLDNDYNEFIHKLYSIFQLTPLPSKKKIHKNKSYGDRHLYFKRRLNIFSTSRINWMNNTGIGKWHHKWMIDIAAIFLSKLTENSSIDEIPFNWPTNQRCDALMYEFALSNRKLVDKTNLPLEKYGYLVRKI